MEVRVVCDSISGGRRTVEGGGGDGDGGDDGASVKTEV